MKPPKVMICMPVGSGSVPWPTALSLIKTLKVCRDGGLPVVLEVVAGCSVITWARSALADAFLKGDCSHLMWIDSDVVWEPSDFLRLVGLGAVLDVVGATYPFKKQPITFLVNHDGKPGQYTVNGLGCVRILGMGIGFTLVKREVMEKVAATKPMRRDPVTGLEYRDIFRIDHEGEDLAFFTDVRALGYTCWLDPSVQLGHYGSAIYKGDPIEALGLEGHAREISSGS